MNTYWFCEMESGEEFFVEAENNFKAWEIALEIFGDDDAVIHSYGKVTEEFAEAAGYDTY